MHTSCHGLLGHVCQLGKNGSLQRALPQQAGSRWFQQPQFGRITTRQRAESCCWPEISNHLNGPFMGLFRVRYSPQNLENVFEDKEVYRWDKPHCVKYTVLFDTILRLASPYTLLYCTICHLYLYHWVWRRLSMSIHTFNSCCRPKPACNSRLNTPSKTNGWIPKIMVWKMFLLLYRYGHFWYLWWIFGV